MKNSKTRVEEFIRVDHAGERGAVKIYEGQLLALNTIIKNERFMPTNIFDILGINFLTWFIILQK